MDLFPDFTMNYCRRGVSGTFSDQLCETCWNLMEFGSSSHKKKQVFTSGAFENSCLSMVALGQGACVTIRIWKLQTFSKELKPYTIWRFPKIGVPLVIIHFHRVFQSKPSRYWGTPWYPSFRKPDNRVVSQVLHRSWLDAAMPC